MVSRRTFLKIISSALVLSATPKVAAEYSAIIGRDGTQQKNEPLPIVDDLTRRILKVCRPQVLHDDGRVRVLAIKTLSGETIVIRRVDGKWSQGHRRSPRFAGGDLRAAFTRDERPAGREVKSPE